MNKTKWIYYTVVVGLLPIILRALIGLFLNDNTSYDFIVTFDILFFGLLLGISNINEIELIYRDKYRDSWVTRTNGISLTAIIVFSVLIAITLIDETYDLFRDELILSSSGLLSLIFLYFTYTVYQNSKLQYYA